MNEANNALPYLVSKAELSKHAEAGAIKSLKIEIDALYSPIIYSRSHLLKKNSYKCW